MMAVAKVLVAVRVNPEDIDVDLDKLVDEVKAKLPKEFEVVRHEKVYIAFGLYALRLFIIMPEEYEGGTEDIEKFLTSIKGVASVDVEMVTRTEAFK